MQHSAGMLCTSSRAIQSLCSCPLWNIASVPTKGRSNLSKRSPLGAVYGPPRFPSAPWLQAFSHLSDCWASHKPLFPLSPRSVSSRTCLVCEPNDEPNNGRASSCSLLCLPCHLSPPRCSLVEPMSEPSWGMYVCVNRVSCCQISTSCSSSPAGLRHPHFL